MLRQAETPLIAVVRLRKRDEWVLPKGKLDDGETPRAAAEREVLEETGHKVSVQEFLGTLVYQSGGRSKVVHYWRMKASGGPVRELMYDVRAVDWLPLEEAVARLSRGYEQAFLQTVGPIALEALANAETSAAAACQAGGGRKAPQPAARRGACGHRARAGFGRRTRTGLAASPCRLRRSPYRIACRSPRMRVPPLQMASSKPSQRWRQRSPWSRRPLP